MKIIATKSNEVPVLNNTVFLIKDYKPRVLKRHCNLCEEEFNPRTKFERYCEKCRVESELYHFAEWLSA